MNKKMKNAWNTALKFLKADTKNIEHGLELHLTGALEKRMVRAQY